LLAEPNVFETCKYRAKYVEAEDTPDMEVTEVHSGVRLREAGDGEFECFQQGGAVEDVQHVEKNEHTTRTPGAELL